MTSKVPVYRVPPFPLATTVAAVRTAVTTTVTVVTAPLPVADVVADLLYQEAVAASAVLMFPRLRRMLP